MITRTLHFHMHGLIWQTAIHNTKYLLYHIGHNCVRQMQAIKAILFMQQCGCLPDKYYLKNSSNQYLNLTEGPVQQNIWSPAGHLIL